MDIRALGHSVCKFAQACTHFAQARKLIAATIEVRRFQPGPKRRLELRPFGVDDGKPRSVPVAIFVDGRLAKNAFRTEAQPLRRSAGFLIQRIALPFVATESEFVEHATHQQKHRFRTCPRALESLGEIYMSDLDHARIKVYPQVARNTDSRSTGLVNNRVEHRVFAQASPHQPIVEPLPFVERTIRQIGPVSVIRTDAQRSVKIVAVPFRLDRLHSAIVSIDPRSRRQLPARPVRNREADPLPILTEELSHFACFQNFANSRFISLSAGRESGQERNCRRLGKANWKTDNGLMEWWATLESNQAWVSPAELQSAAAPCSPSPIRTLRLKAQADNSLTYLGQGRQSTIIWAGAPYKRGTLANRLLGSGIPKLPLRLDCNSHVQSYNHLRCDQIGSNGAITGSARRQQVNERSKKVQFECIADCKNSLGECCFWDPRDERLRWTDIEGRSIFQLNSDGTVVEFPLPDRAGFVLPRQNSGFVVGFANWLALADQTLENFERLHDIERDLPETRINDATVDPFGGVVFGTFNENPDKSARRPNASVYRLAPDGSVEKLFGGITVTNGLEFSLDGRTMYFADTGDGVIRRYSVGDEFSALNEIEPLAGPDIAPGMPDGATIDSDGNYWNARVWGGRVISLDRYGNLVQNIELPVKGPTCVAFGGNDLKDIYVTSLRTRHSDADLLKSPLAGGLFKARAEIPGRAQPMCRL